jgi:hypothetical protein
MRRERYDSERLSDNAVLLALWARVQESNGAETVGDRLKLMKLAFLAAYRLYQDRVKALNLQVFAPCLWYNYTKAGGRRLVSVGGSFSPICHRLF